MTTPIRILGIDPGLRRTGWGLIALEGSRQRFLAAGTIVPDATLPLCQRLLAIHRGLTAVVDEARPDEAAVEATFVNRDAAATLKLGQARGIAMVVPAAAGLAVAEYAPNLVKKTVVGVGHGDKRQVRAMVARLLPRARIEDDDTADALAIALTHAAHRAINARRPLEAAP